ncbi:ricin-type beta-trefoil lectin domain protein [Parendozoicomonas haliclonae]
MTFKNWRRCLKTGAALLSGLCLSAQAVVHNDSPAGISLEPEALAQGCYAFMSPETGKKLTLTSEGYRFQDVPFNQATGFFIKPTELDSYMLLDQEGGYLGTRLPMDLQRGEYPGEFVEWGINKRIHNGQSQYQLVSRKFDKSLWFDKGRGWNYLFNLFNLQNGNSEQWFSIAPQTGCMEYPEASLNASVDQNKPATSDINEPVVGIADSHFHITASEFIGGKFHSGSPFHRYGIAHALGNCDGIHGPWGSLDIIGNAVGFGNVDARHDTRGYPDFPSWPMRQSLSHEQSYYKWVERAHLGGVKFMVNHLVENAVLCNIQKTVNPASWINPNDCNEMNSVDHQLNFIRKLEDYIDAQEGGPGKGWFRIVYSPGEARKVIADGKMAVMLGIEVSELFDCREPTGCSNDHINNQLDEYYNKGIRTMFPVHRFDNKFGGSNLGNSSDLMNVGNKLSSGHFFYAEACTDEPSGTKLPSGFPLIGNLPVFKPILTGLGLNPEYDQTLDQHCNALTISDQGRYLMERMAAKGMIIDLDHMSGNMQREALTILEGLNYSGALSSHAGTKYPGPALSPVQQRLIALGGLISPYNGSVGWMSAQIEVIGAEQSKNGQFVGVGFGTDVNGIAPQASGMGVTGNPVTYPFTSYDGRVTFEQPKTGNRTFDYNEEGMAHYGLLPEHLENYRRIGADNALAAIFNSAEAYLRMWERAESSTNTAEYRELKNEGTGLCLDIYKGSNNNGTNVIQWTCHGGDNQKWAYEPATGFLRNKMGKCLDNRGQANNDGEIVIWDCVDSDNLRFDMSGGVLRNRHNNTIVVDAFGANRGDNVGQWRYHGGNNQRWYWGN